MHKHLNFNSRYYFDKLNQLSTFIIHYSQMIIKPTNKGAAQKMASKQKIST